ncbi:hypothetical protein MUY35_06880 [Aliiroseovarius sp. S1339]|uniref:hypothetical protein n=1 Tax=Aliiroseovarius sp. S1339 TaxID=2936990 RepID=UPI0020BD85EE|nr:hypothetical protein [Aliiroseovarius sp. S1339]MCK8463572.1 hypothetical protein [Aliiroseovarius sp. S1339]
MLRLFRKLFKNYTLLEMLQGLWDWWPTTLIISVMLTATSAVLAYLQDSTALEIWLIAIFTVFLSLGIIWFANSLIKTYRQFSRLYFHKVIVRLGVKTASDGPKILQSVNIGFFIENASDHLFRYKVEYIRTSFAGRVNPAPTYENRGGEIGGRTIHDFVDAEIIIDEPLKERSTYNGTLEALISYNTHKRRPRYLKIKRNIILHMNEYPNFVFKDVERLDDFTNAEKLAKLMKGIA